MGICLNLIGPLTYHLKHGHDTWKGVSTNFNIILANKHENETNIQQGHMSVYKQNCTVCGHSLGIKPAHTQTASLQMKTAVDV